MHTRKLLRAWIPAVLALLVAHTPASAVPASDVLTRGYEAYLRGWEHFHGRNGRSRDYRAARQYYQRAVALGYTEAHYGLATLYSRGLGVSRDWTRARHHYERAAAGGFAKAWYNLGVIYHHGHGVTTDVSRARVFFQIAADLGLATAHFALGYLQEHGIAGPPSWEVARRHYLLGAQGGCVKAQHRLAQAGLEWEQIR